MVRTRKPAEPTVYEGGLVPGNVVICESPYNFTGSRIAIILDKQKWCKDGIPVMLADEDEPIRYLCMMDYHGDTVRKP
jgi:hypothetical protein